MRKFERVLDKYIKYNEFEYKAPFRATKCSAGYDLFSPVEMVLKPNEPQMIWTNVKAQLNENEFLMLCSTSGMGKKNIRMSNSIGIIDADYFGNESNDGNLGFRLINDGAEDYIIHKWDKIGQAIFLYYLKVDDDIESKDIRKGGFGSTNK